MQVSVIKNRLLTQGVNVVCELDEGRKGGAGPIGNYLVLNNSVVNFSVNPKSPFTLLKKMKKYVLQWGDEEIDVNIPPRPRFYDDVCSGVPMRHIALRHGVDVLASTIYQRCHLMEEGVGCKFCGIELSLQYGHTIERKTAEMMAEVAERAWIYGDATHVTLTMGALASEREGIEMMKEVCAAIKEVTPMPVHVQILPPENLSLLDDIPCDTIGIHLETFDEEVMKHITPGKWMIGRHRFMKALQRAVELFGESQVSTFVLLGIGERRDVTLGGCKKLCEMGIIPYIVPFRPIQNTEMSDSPPPTPSYTEGMMREVASMIRDHGVRLEKNRAGCVRCGGCSPIREFVEEVR